MASANFYNVEIRNKAGSLRTYVTPFVQDLTWEWNRIGGCGNARFRINKAYRSIEFQAGDDVQIRIRSGSAGKLVYRGWITAVKPALKIGQSITIEARGYFDKLKMMVVHSSGDTKTYANKEMSEIVTDIVDTFITPNSDITKGTINAGNFAVDTIGFLTTIDSALKTIAEMTGDIEYGVDEDLVFFWRTEAVTLTKRFMVGADIETLERNFDYSRLLNKIYFQGGNVNGVTFRKTAEADDSQTTYFLAEGIISNSSITTDTVADQYLSAILHERASPRLNISAKIPNTDLRLEDTIPMGMVAFYDSDYDQVLKLWGKTANGGSNYIWGRAASGGSEGIWGGVYKGQIRKITYKLSDTQEKFNINILLGDTMLETSARIKRIENNVDSIIQKG